MITRSPLASRKHRPFGFPEFAIIKNHGFSFVGANLVFAPIRAITRIAPTEQWPERLVRKGGIEKEQYIRPASIIYIGRRGGSGYGGAAQTNCFNRGSWISENVAARVGG